MVRERWPGIRVEVFENTGHALFVDEPERLNRVLEQFLVTLVPEPITKAALGGS
jgi:pimeloyl-ACP methyl ester carboxylesterase